MIFVNINTAKFYQFPKAAGIRKNRQPKVSSLYSFMALEPSKKEKRTLLSLDQIKNLDMTDLPLKKPLNLFCMLALNLNGIKTDVKGIVLLCYYLNK